ncbi:hypothetical protein B0H17DRAFT_1125001 [Mycena rosella]|uniref:Uncharacterized protein n=1 Tax=Mycena rosella TaxID=1033263 RepID=A0AAD7MAR0_MYCRO|nr:hypothetical protein B0H17DRAFT_1125001 [Mycena rosella]
MVQTTTPDLAPPHQKFEVLANECDKFDESKPPSRVTSPPTVARARRPLKIQESRCDFKHRSLKFEAWLDLAGSHLKIVSQALQRGADSTSGFASSFKTPVCPGSSVNVLSPSSLSNSYLTRKFGCIQLYLPTGTGTPLESTIILCTGGHGGSASTRRSHGVGAHTSCLWAETEHNKWEKVKQVAQTRVVEVVDGSW